jgi:hypothetical protein
MVGNHWMVAIEVQVVAEGGKGDVRDGGFGMEAFEKELLDSIRKRPEGISVLDAFGRFVMEPRGLLAAEDPAAKDPLLGITA